MQQCKKITNCLSIAYLSEFEPPYSLKLLCEITGHRFVETVAVFHNSLSKIHA